MAAWFVEKLKRQNFSCFYCETSIFDINKLIDEGLLKTRAVKGEGRRGPVLEIDKNDDVYVPEITVTMTKVIRHQRTTTKKILVQIEKSTLII